MIASPDRLEAPPPANEVPVPRPRSGGPRTPEGKERSRRNAMKHGLRARVILPDDLAAAVAERTALLRDEFEASTEYEEWLVGEMARAMARLDRCAEMAVADLRRCVDRAALCWEDDRKKAVEDLAARLPKEPSRVVRALRQSRQGADWLLERWEGLDESLRSLGGWDEAQRRLAFDLLGVPLELRLGSTRVPPPADAEGLAGLIRREVARLRDDRDAVLDELDDAERSMAVLGMPLDEDATTARLRRYEASCRRAMNWAHSELRRLKSDASPAPKTPAEPEPPRPTLPKSAVAFLAKRSELADLAAVEEIAEAPAVVEPAIVEVPAVAEVVVEAPAVVAKAPAVRTLASPSPRLLFEPQLNRRGRRAEEKQARQAARR